MHPIARSLAATAVAAIAAVAVATPPAGAAPSCVAQEVAMFQAGQRGAILSEAARSLHPFGRHASATATSPKDACPFAEE